MTKTKTKRRAPRSATKPKARTTKFTKTDGGIIIRNNVTTIPKNTTAIIWNETDGFNLLLQPIKKNAEVPMEVILMAALFERIENTINDDCEDKKDKKDKKEMTKYPSPPFPAGPRYERKPDYKKTKTKTKTKKGAYV